MINYKLIRTSEGYIIISDVEIQVNDLLISELGFIVKFIRKDINSIMVSTDNNQMCSRVNPIDYKKIVASTYLNGLPNIVFNSFEERVNFDNIELLAKEYIEKESKEIAIPASFFYNGLYYYEQCFIAGYNKCLEINKDKLYTAEQMKEFAIEVSSFDTHANPITSIDEHFNNFIKYLKPNVDDFVDEINEYLETYKDHFIVKASKQDSWNIEIEHYACAEDYGVCIEGCIGKCNPKIIDNKIKITKIL